MAADANPWIVHVARMRRNAGAESHEVRRGHVDEAGPLAEEGIEFHPLPRLPDERN